MNALYGYDFIAHHTRVAGSSHQTCVSACKLCSLDWLAWYNVLLCKSVDLNGSKMPLPVEVIMSLPEDIGVNECVWGGCVGVCVCAILTVPLFLNVSKYVYNSS